ncbi:hypothetical protein EV426DRAFT_95899 [Tirmania nivea]|nr:hypothetical protein EV426DRAFT_95899 [Tirmania nivea]
MKAFTTLIALIAAAMAITSMAAPNTAGAPETKELKERQFSDSPEFPESECAIAVEFDLPTTLDKRQKKIIGPPNFWCCDGYTGTYHSGDGKRVCCPTGSGCCNLATNSVWLQPGFIKSVMPVGGDETIFLKSGKKCSGSSCQQCKLVPTIPNNPGWQSLKRNGC